MAGVNKNRIGNDDIYEAVDAVKGGQLVVWKTGATNPGVQGITPAGDGATNVLGVAGRSATPVAKQIYNGADVDGYDTLFVNPVTELTVVYKGCVLDVTYTAAAVAFGVKLKAAADGAVAAWASGTDAASLIVGESRCVLGDAGGTDKALIY